MRSLGTVVRILL